MSHGKKPGLEKFCHGREAHYDGRVCLDGPIAEIYKSLEHKFGCVNGNPNAWVSNESNADQFSEGLMILGASNLAHSIMTGKAKLSHYSDGEACLWLTVSVGPFVVKFPYHDIPRSEYELLEVQLDSTWEPQR